MKIRRIDGKTGKAEWHTLHEWNIINGYEKPDEIIPFIEIIDGEVVEEFASSRTPRLRHIALAIAQSQPQQKRAVEKPKMEKATGGYGGNEPTDPTMFEPS